MYYFGCPHVRQTNKPFYFHPHYCTEYFIQHWAHLAGTLPGEKVVITSMKSAARINSV